MANLANLANLANMAKITGDRKSATLPSADRRSALVVPGDPLATLGQELDYGFGASGQRPYQSNGCGLRFTTTFLVWV